MHTIKGIKYMTFEELAEELNYSIHTLRRYNSKYINFPYGCKDRTKGSRKSIFPVDKVDEFMRKAKIEKPINLTEKTKQVLSNYNNKVNAPKRSIHLKHEAWERSQY